MSPISETQLETTKKEIKIATAAVIANANLLTIERAAHYAEADSWLARIRDKKKEVEAKIDPIIKPLREGLEKLYEFKRDLIRPLEDAEKSVKSKMVDYKMEEVRRLREAQLVRERNEQQLRQQIQEKERAEAAAKTEAMREKLAQQRAALEVEAESVTLTPSPAPLKAAHSSTRAVKVWTLPDFRALVQAVATGKVPLAVLSINKAVIDKALRDEPDTVAGWPGVEVRDDFRIVGR